jgi:hypothetical protein
MFRLRAEPPVMTIVVASVSLLKKNAVQLAAGTGATPAGELESSQFLKLSTMRSQKREHAVWRRCGVRVNVNVSSARIARQMMVPSWYEKSLCLRSSS